MGFSHSISHPIAARKSGGWSARAVSVATVFFVSLGGAAHAASLMEVDVAGVHLGEACKEAQATFLAGHWEPHYGGGQLSFSNAHEYVTLDCVRTPAGDAIAGIRYRPDAALISRDELAASALKKFGEPAVAAGVNPKWDKEYRIGWGDVSNATVEWSQDESTGPSAFYEFITRTDGSAPHLIALRAGKAWEKAQAAQLAAEQAAQVRATTRPSF